MSVTAAHESLVYEFVEEWAQLPDGASFNEVAGVAVDREDRVYVFNRGKHPMMVFDPNGKFLSSWGEGMFHVPHGLDIGHDNAIYCTDCGDHTVRKFTLDGRLEMVIGIPGSITEPMSGRPFNSCTHTALSPEGEIYVSDGYCNACVHKFSADGKLLFSWGEQGSLPGQFYLPHNICCDKKGLVYVTDRENHRIQVFDGAGKYQRQWNNLVRPNAVYITEGDEQLFYVAECGPLLDHRAPQRNLGPRVSILNGRGEAVKRLGEGNPGFGPDQFVAPHGIAVDSRGDIYVGEVACSVWPVIFPDLERPSVVRTLRKLRLVSR